ncbi:aryl-sulfate sulfotransferase [Nonlabens ulvanivorans]|uniref:aryl-sulfate sulfotransferase n=1 Tax=Nonlabens ulvanivorans TaxID=906888 RepID=UPI0037C85659
MKFLFILFSLLAISSCKNDDDLMNTASNLKPNDAVTIFIPNEVPEDFILITPIRSDTTYLINREGKEVHKWYATSSPTLMAYLMDDGSLIRTVYTDIDNGIAIGGKTGKLQIIDKDNNLKWEWLLDNSTESLHHDIAILPNGNLLASVWEVKDENSSISNGRDPQKLFENRLIIDKIIEIEPIGSNQANIIWEWSLWDHLIQDFDAAQLNFGTVASHPELFDINMGVGIANFSHGNGLDYILEHDQIVLNSRELSEFFLIDHSTTTAEAASSSGGNSGKGGDLLFRYGNPQNFKTGSSNDQIFNGPHDGTYVGSNVNSLGSFLIFDNLDGIDFSTVKEINVPISIDGRYPSIINQGNVPDSPIWSYSDTAIYSKRTSGAQRLPSGNTLITSNSGLIIREVNPLNQIVWEYNFENEAANQLMLQSNGFKNRSYPVNFAGIQALELIED